MKSDHYEVELEGRIVAVFQPFEQIQEPFKSQTSTGPLEYAKQTFMVGSLLEMGPDLPTEVPIPEAEKWCENESWPKPAVIVRVTKIEGCPTALNNGLITEGPPPDEYRSKTPGHEHVIGKVTVERVAL